MNLLNRFLCTAILSVIGANAATILSYSVEYNGNIIAPGVDNVQDVTSGAYSITGTLDVFQGGSPVTTGVPLTGPISLRFTNAQISCDSLSPCSPTAMFFAAYLIFDGAAPTDLTGSFGIEGIGSVDSPLTVLAGGASTEFIANFSSVGNFSQSQSLPGGFTVGNSSEALEFRLALQIPAGLDAGGQIFLPDSLFQQLDTTSSVPEPGTLAIVAGGLAGAYWFRRRQR